MHTATIASTQNDFERLIAAHRGLIVKVAASYCADAADRADLAQEIALQLWRAWRSYDRSRAFSTWAYRIALNVAITHRRRARHRHEEPIGAEHEALVGTHDVDAEQRERFEIVARAMQSLTPLDRALLLLHLEGVDQRESADVLGISESNVSTRLSRIRQQLRRVAAAGQHEGTEHGNA